MQQTDWHKECLRVLYAVFFAIKLLRGEEPASSGHSLYREAVMFELKRMICILVVLATLASAFSAAAETYYVATTGDDSDPGTEAQPWATVVKAASTMVAGDTTYVKSGTYVGTVRFSRSGTQTAPIRLLNYPGHTPKIQATTDPGNPITVATGNDTIPIAWIVIEGFELTSSASTKRSVFCVRYISALNVTIRNNVIHDCGQGILGYGYRVTIDRNRIYHNDEHGMYVTGTSYTITNNVIYDNINGYGIQTAGYPVGQSPTPGPEYMTFKNNLIANNTIAFQQVRAAITLWQADAQNNTITNNIFYENAQTWVAAAYGIDCVSSGGGHVLRNNLFYATSPGSTLDLSACAGKYTETGRITAKPQFVNEGARDFRLVSGSPGIDKGVIVPEVTTDFAGARRPQGTAYDVGAYELPAGSADTTPPAPPQNVAVR